MNYALRSTICATVLFAVGVLLISNAIRQVTSGTLKTLGVFLLEGRRIPGTQSIASKAAEHGVTEKDMVIIRNTINAMTIIALITAVVLMI